jgi:cyclopropane-fatty-acyl-phospholipid synthase
MMLLQAITMPDQRYERYRRSVDFIQRYVFPGSCVPSIAAMNDAMRRSSDLRLTHLEDIGPHYARTLRDWRRRFFERIDDVRAQGYPETFIRLWEYYLCYCEAGFEERYIGDVQMLLAKPRSRREPIVSTIERSASNPSGLG